MVVNSDMFETFFILLKSTHLLTGGQERYTCRVNWSIPNLIRMEGVEEGGGGEGGGLAVYGGFFGLVT